MPTVKHSAHASIRQVPEEIRNGLPYYEFYEGSLSVSTWATLARGATSRADLLAVILDFQDCASEGGVWEIGGSSYKLATALLYPLMEMIGVDRDEYRVMFLAAAAWTAKRKYRRGGEIPDELRHLCDDPEAKPRRQSKADRYADMDDAFSDMLEDE
jgi:hypothetical protein